MVLYPTFAERYPLAKPVWGKALAEQDNVITTGGPLSGGDLVIYIVRRHLGDQLTKAENLIRYWNPAMAVEQLAEALSTTTRTLNRQMKALLQKSTKRFITRVRIETATLLLESPGKTISHIANACGYGDETTFRRAFIIVTGMSSCSFRERLKTTHFSNAGIQLARCALTLLADLPPGLDTTFS